MASPKISPQMEVPQDAPQINLGPKDSGPVRSPAAPKANPVKEVIMVEHKSSNCILETFNTRASVDSSKTSLGVASSTDISSHEDPPQLDDPQDSASKHSAPTHSDPVDSSQMYHDEAYLVGSNDDDESNYYDDEYGPCPECGGYHGGESPTGSHLYYLEKPEAPPKQLEPFLTSFTLFPKLPAEMREMIWRHTLEPRTVEIEYNVNHGFYSRAKVPIALRTCPDSRQAVLKSYPSCFGSILHSPCTVFNFSLDTLYFDWDMQPRITQFIVSMSKTETESIQSIAVDHLMEDAEIIGAEYVSEDKPLETFKTASKAMPVLKEFLIVSSLHEEYHEHGFPCGFGPIVLFEEFPYELQMFVWSERCHMEDHDEDCGVNPGWEDMTEGFDVPKTGPVFGWRPAKLTFEDSPAWPYPSKLFARNSKP